jgi:hypothetical protein
MLGRRVVFMGSKAEAETYMQSYLYRGITDVSILKFSIQKSTLQRFKALILFTFKRRVSDYVPKKKSGLSF